MSNIEKPTDSNEKFEFSFEKSIGERTEYHNMFCHEFATEIINKFVGEYDIKDSEITIKIDLATLANISAEFLHAYGNHMIGVYDNVKSGAGQYSEAELNQYGLNFKEL